ncbi:class I SAM-dependent methyltransferase [Candidatus Woesearchaeota archaeon]|nr:MAG: Methyltransferase type 11 [archaeon GW2011_AR4]MBS3129402.1 class I SAM-dependent methyltransferase [Candidatus Woesearchaeota archaeon]HIH38444.1 class I SAM-dependent methyltransferase [Candidatus Woesearchaeota archaeon]HIH48098.1 class I SAM-dependent methyltransferase [Candidatus Woesearchaeota archaeon]HIJ03457.1 class I SAM-dependent methyltransferase [Candidatus Woesearchaeota archaeon]
MEDPSKDVDYDESYYAPLVKRYTNKTRMEKYTIANVMRLAEIKPGSHVLELGCGKGTFSIECSKLGCTTVGVDRSPVAAKLAERMFRMYGKGKGRFLVSDCADIKIDEKKEKFDYILAINLVEHIYNTVFIKMLKECKRLLNKDGKIVIYAPSQSHYLEKIKKIGLNTHSGIGHISYKTLPYMVNELKKAGFVVDEAYYWGSHLPLLGTVDTMLSFLPLFRRRICIRAHLGM